jgi:hypothetical protein
MSEYVKPAFQLAQIIQDNKHRLDELEHISGHQKGVMTSIAQCRTIELGGHWAACDHCGSSHYTFHSCRNRHCNQCGGMKRDKWVHDRKADMLPVKYFHVVFTIPHQLNELCLNNQVELYKLLMHSAWQTLQQFGKDHRHLGAKTGAVMVLHTWGQNLAYHPHVHCMVPAGGVTKQGKWRDCKNKGKFFAPVKQMGKVFRGKFTDGLIQLHNQENIQLDTPFIEDRKYLHPLYKHNWVVYAKKPLPSGEKVIDYIGRYIHRVAISNHRIKEYSGENVSFSWLDYRTSKLQISSMESVDFLQQFALHILPKGFCKVRHYGILACRNKTLILNDIREQLGAEPVEEPEKLNWVALYEKLYGVNPLICKCCGQGTMVIVEEIPSARDGPKHDVTSGLMPQYM